MCDTGRDFLGTGWGVRKVIIKQTERAIPARKELAPSPSIPCAGTGKEQMVVKGELVNVNFSSSLNGDSPFFGWCLAARCGHYALAPKLSCAAHVCRMRSAQQFDRRDGPSERDRPAYSSGRRDDRWDLSQFTRCTTNFQALFQLLFALFLPYSTRQFLQPY